MDRLTASPEQWLLGKRDTVLCCTPYGRHARRECPQDIGQENNAKTFPKGPEASADKLTMQARPQECRNAGDATPNLWHRLEESPDSFECRANWPVEKLSVSSPAHGRYFDLS